MLLSTDRIASTRAVLSDFGLAKAVDSKADLWRSLLQLELKLIREDRQKQRRAGGAAAATRRNRRDRAGSQDSYDSASSGNVLGNSSEVSGDEEDL